MIGLGEQLSQFVTCDGAGWECPLRGCVRRPSSAVTALSLWLLSRKRKVKIVDDVACYIVENGADGLKRQFFELGSVSEGGEEGEYEWRVGDFPLE